MILQGSVYSAWPKTRTQSTAATFIFVFASAHTHRHSMSFIIKFLLKNESPRKCYGGSEKWATNGT